MLVLLKNKIFSSMVWREVVATLLNHTWSIVRTAAMQKKKNPVRDALTLKVSKQATKKVFVFKKFLKQVNLKKKQTVVYNMTIVFSYVENQEWKLQLKCSHYKHHNFCVSIYCT